MEKAKRAQVAPRQRPATKVTELRSTSPLPTPQQKTKSYPFWWLILIPALTFVAFATGLQNDFVDWDDSEYVFQNPYLLNPSANGLRDLLKSVVALNYHPLTMGTLWLNAALFGLKPGSFIATNVVIHASNAVLLFLLCRRLNVQHVTAGIIALIWAIHPMHVESVVWVSERKDVLYTFFFLLSCLAYLQAQGSNRTGWLAAAFGLFVFACLSKAMAVTLPLVLLLLDYWQQRPVTVKSVAEKLPFFAVALFIGAIAVNVQAGGDFYGWLHLIQQKKEAVGKEPFAGRWLVYGSFSFVMYILKLVIPHGMVAFYPYPDTTQVAAPYYWLGPPVLLAALGWIGWCLIRPKTVFRRLSGFGLGFFLITILLVLQFMTVGAAMMADRYSYLPYAGLLFLLVNGTYQWVASKPRAQRMVTAGFCGFAVVCLVLTMQQVKVWKNTETLWMHALKYYPNEDRLHEGLGIYYGKQNRLDEAIAHFSAAVSDGTTSFHCYEGLGNAYSLKGDLTKALSFYNRALQLESNNGDLQYNMGLTLNKMGRYQEAEQTLTHALTLSPEKDTAILAERGFSYLQLKMYKQSITDYDIVLSKQPNQATALHNRGVCEFYLGKRAKAIADIRRAVALRPDYSEAIANLKQLEQLPVQ